MTHQIAETTNFPSLAAASVILFLVYQVATLLYNAYLHPLRKFPGPKFLATTPLVRWWSLATGCEVASGQALHQKYGPVVRVGPKALSFTSAQAWKDIAGFTPGKAQLKKDPEFYGEKQRGHHGLIDTPDDKDHGRQRRTLAHAFSDSALREQEPLIKPYFDLLIERLKEQAAKGNRVDVTKWFNLTTFDIIGDLALGESFHALDSGEYHPWVLAIFHSFKFGVLIQLGSIYPLVKFLLDAALKYIPSFRRAHKAHQDYTDERVDRRLAQDTGRRDFMSYMPRDKDGLNDGQLKNNAEVLIIAGSETTATLLSGLTYLSLTNPRVYSKLVHEIRSSFTSEDEINFTKVAKLSYLHAVIEESLRLYPPVPNRVPRVTGPEGNMIDGQFVPPGTSVAVLQYAAGRSPDNWHNPAEFFPERFTSEAPAEYIAKDVKASLQPFSTGPRNCLGKNLAYNEMRTITARILWNFDLELCEESREWTKQRTYLLWEKPPLWVKLSVRKSL